MTITATITRRIPITQLRPGALIDGHTVDSIEIVADGAAAWCWPPGRSSGRRVRMPLGAIDGEVTVSAGEGEAQAAVQELGRLLVDGDGDVGGTRCDHLDLGNTLLGVPLPSGWTFALHGDEPVMEPTGALPVPDDADEDD